MKNKSMHHKDTNTFKFQRFSERIENIDVDIFHRIGHEYESQEDEVQCHFHQAIENWSILNLTEGFNDFKREIKGHTLITLPQLLLDKDRVVGVLLKHLKLKNSLCSQPLLDLVVALAKDLRKDFYVYYKEFLEVLIDLLNTRDTEQLEWIFTCLAYLFKFLWRPMIKDITSVFNGLLPLLSSNKPEYINNFAAESFAFVARKVKDHEAFVLHIITTIENQKDGIKGCGRLLFETVNGVNRQFHSCAETLLPFLISLLSNPKFPRDTLFQILRQIVSNITANIDAKKGELLWKTLVSSIQSPEDAEITGLKLKLLGQAIEDGHGKFLRDPAPVVSQLMQLFAEKPTEMVLKLLVEVCSLLLLLKNIKLTQEQASQITRTIMQVPQKKIVLNFVDNITEFTLFKMLVLPKFLELCSEFDEDCSDVLTRLILKKAPRCESGVSLDKWVKYPIEFQASIEEKIVQDLSAMNFDKYVSAATCIPHLKLKDDKLEILERNVSHLLKNVATEKKRETLFLLNLTVECIVHLNGDLLQHFDEILDVLLPLAVTELYALKSIDLMLTYYRSNPVIDIALLEKINVLSSNFNSPLHDFRLITAHLYSLFEDLPEFDLKHSTDPDVPKEKFEVFSLCYHIESIESHVHTYREQVRCLEKLGYDKPQILMCNQTKFKTVPLRYVCGVLYMNFKLLWEPVLKIIVSYASGMDSGEFWQIYGEELKNVVKYIREGSEAQWVVPTSKFCVEQPKFTFMEGIRHLKKDVIDQQFNHKPDFLNYRTLLWKAMASFPEIAEQKTRDISELLLDFVDQEYTRNNSDLAMTWNIKQNETEGSEEDKEDEAENKEEQRVKLRGVKTNAKVLVNFLTVFAKIRSPKSMYREPELAKLYFDLLQSKSSDVQKCALDCLMTYKHKYLMPYKDNLYNLIDDKNFKNEVTSFSIDKSNSQIVPEHRPDVIPIIMRIVFSKMSTKTGMRTSGSSGQYRRNLIVRFLAGCDEKEMLSFMQMAFRVYQKYLDDDPEVMIKNLNFELDKFIPPKRLQSTLNLLNVIIEQFGGLMTNELLTFYLQIILIVGTAVETAFLNSSQVHSGYSGILKNLRNTAIKAMERFFNQFDRYPWTSKQINAIFDVFVWPYLEKLNIEGIHSPTALLKLFVQWGLNPTYFPLLIKSNDGTYPLEHIVKLYLNVKSNTSVINAIEDMFEKMLSLQAAEDEEPLSVDGLKSINESILARINEKINYGSCIMLPHVPDVLDKIKRKLGSKSKNLNQKELFILSRISELVWEADISDETLKLLLPVLLKRAHSGEAIVTPYLSSVLNLLGNVAAPQNHFRQISPLFGEIPYVSGRKLLCQILGVVVAKDASLSEAASIVDGLNAFDAKWVDQPDFERRNETLKLIQKSIEDDTLGMSIGVLIVYNCFFMLKNEKSLTTSETISHHLKYLCKYLVAKYPKNLDYILDDTILALIRNGMKSKNEVFRPECISLLGYLARECPDRHIVLKDLNKYTNKQELEIDFFENLTNIQLQYHQRALLRFCQTTRALSVAPNVRTLTQFILPFASHYLCCDKYSGKKAIIDNAIECIEVVCRILPWHQYESLLKFYLSKLRRDIDNQKQLVRITVAILDAFHFDLHKAQVVAEALPSEETTKGDASEENTNEAKISEADEEGDGEVEADEEDESEALDGELELKAEEEDEENEVTDGTEATQEKDLPGICEKVVVLCKSTATRVIRTIQVVLLPQLHKSLAQMTRYDASHKVNRKKLSHEREDEDLLKVPISLALVKLLQRLPNEILKANLPGIFMKLCTFLKSHLESVRRVARETLQKIMLTLGPDYLDACLGEMVPLLNRGFQVHVLVYTTHAILTCLKESFSPGHIDKVLLTVLELCKADLFGALAEERDVVKIAVKTSEAKSTKCFDTYQILAQYITEKCMMDLVLPVKNVLQNSRSFKIVNKAQDCLRHITLGLVDNVFIETESLVKFAYGTASERIPQLVAGSNKQDKSAKPKSKFLEERKDCLIIPKAPVGRSGVRRSNVKFSEDTNAHVLVEFGLRLCFMLLKREKLKDKLFIPFLDPFVLVFKSCLTSKHIKLNILTLQCLGWIMKYELPSMEEHIEDISKDMFAILHKYASAGLGKGDNFDLIVAAFKTMAVLVRDVKYHTIDTEQLKVLLLYAEQDMHDHDRQATAFNLLRAIIFRKLIVPEIHEVMAKVSELSITSELNHVRLHSRQVFHQYLMDYPLAGKLDDHLSFYLSQLSYEMQSGRESAIEMIDTLISSFPMGVLKEHSGTMFVTLGARLVQDEVPECRKMVANCLSSLLTRLPKSDREALFDIVYTWFRDKKMNHRRLAAQVCGIFVTVEKEVFETRLRKISPIILKQFGLAEKSKDTEESEEAERIKDYHLYQVLQLLLKICSNCPSFFKTTDVIENLSRHVQSLLNYPHEWVRLSATQFLGFVLSSMDIEKLTEMVVKNQTGEGYLHRDPVENIKSLALDLCDQLKPGNTNADMAEQVIKNLVFVARVLRKVPVKEGNKDASKINLLWLTKRIRKIINSEVVDKNATNTVLRTAIFMWIAGVITVLESSDAIMPIINHLMAPLVREMVTTEEGNAPLRQLAKKVGKIIKDKIGLELYSSTLMQLQQSLSVKRVEQKRKRAQLAVTDPEIFAKKKMKFNEKKKEAKKRKLAEMKGKKSFKRRKGDDDL